MKYTTFITEVQQENSVIIPVEVREKLQIKSGDKIEMTLKKIKSRRLEILISENPLYKLFKFVDD
jgi:AbrB family looped-hinge helix DNA binding protein